MSSDEARLEELLKSMMNDDNGHAPSGTVVSGLDALKALQEEPLGGTGEATSLSQIFDFSENSVLDFSSMPEDFDIPDIDMSNPMDMSETMDMSSSMDMSETVDMPNFTDMSDISENTSIMDLMGINANEDTGGMELDFSSADDAGGMEMDFSSAATAGDDALDFATLFGENSGEDLADIQEMLSKSDNHELLEDNSQSDMEDLFDLFAADTMEAVADEATEQADTIEETPKKEKKKLFGGRRKKDKKKKTASEEADTMEDSIPDDSGDIDIFGMEREEIAQEESKPKKKKRSEKAGFFKKMGESLFGEDEEEHEREPIPDDAIITLSDENTEVLEQLSEEDSSKTKTKKKKDKKRKNKDKSEKSEANADGENDEEAEEEKTSEKKKAKKPKREKKKKVYEEEKPAKKVSKKKVKSVVWVCLTLLAIVVLLKTVGMNMLEMTEARDAYFVGDYKKAYELFKGDELKASDKILMEKATIITRLSHAVETYENHVKLGKKLEALDDLMQGVTYYSELEASGKLDYITSEATDEYHKILELLDADFGLSQQDAKAILEETDLYVYNLQLQDIVDGKPYVRPGEEPEMIQEEKIILDDMLPEEEEYLNGSNN